LKLPKTEKFAGDVLAWFAVVLEQKVRENIALRVMLERRDLTPKKLNEELRKVRESPEVKKRARFQSDEVLRAVRQMIRDLATEETLGQMPSDGKIH
jgi:hypothetical protein